MKLSDEHFEQLTAYLDGELNEHERREVDALLARDPHAAALLESLRQVSASVAALPRELAPTGLSAAVQERMARKSLLDGDSQPHHDLPRLVIWTNRLAIAACLGLVCTAGWLGVQGRGTRGPGGVLNQNNRPVPVKNGDHSKAGDNETLVLNTPGSSLQPASPIGVMGGRTEEVAATPSIDGTMVAYRDAGEFEQQLNKSGVSNFDIQQADLSSFSNRLVIETDDPDLHDAIVRVVADCAEKKKIPDVNTKRLPEPVQAQQCFYVVSRAKRQQTPGQDGEETWIGVNAPIQAAHELMDCVNKVGSQKKAPMQVEMNGCKPVTPNQATQILVDNTVRNLRLQSNKEDETEIGPVMSAPPPAVGMLADASTGRSSKDDVLRDDDAARAKREAASPPGKSQGKESKSYKQSEADEPKEGESKAAAAPTEAKSESESPTDTDDESTMKKDFQGGRHVKDAPSRGGLAKDVRARDEKLGTPPPASKETVNPVTAATPPADGCVTLSICVRNPNVQRQRVVSPSASQASDTIRPSGATSMPQTSKPAAGDQRE